MARPMKNHTAYRVDRLSTRAHAKVKATARQEPTVISPRPPWRSIQRPTGRAARAATPSPIEKAAVMATREAPRSRSMGRRKTGKP